MKDLANSQDSSTSIPSSLPRDPYRLEAKSSKTTSKLEKSLGSQRRHVTPSDSSERKPLKQQVFEELAKNPQLKPNDLCTVLGLDHVKHGHYVRNVRSEWNHHSDFGSVLRGHSLPVRHRRVFECSEKVALCEDRERIALVQNWRVTSNRNRMLLFRRGNGSLAWYRNGLVLIYLHGKAPKARALELFWAGFGFLGDDECSRLSKLIVPMSRHSVFCFGVPLPRMDIRYYESSHGLRLVVDGSHPDSIEVIETEPLYLAKYERILDRFGQEIEAHLDLIVRWKQEAEATRTVRRDYEERIRRPENLETRRRKNRSIWARIGLWLRRVELRRGASC